VIEQRAQRVSREAQCPSLACRHPRQQMTRQRLDVLAPHPQRRDLERDDAQSVEEVFTEATQLHRATEIDVGGGDDASIRSARLALAEALEGPLLDDPQQLDL